MKSEVMLKTHSVLSYGWIDCKSVFVTGSSCYGLIYHILYNQ